MLSNGMAAMLREYSRKLLNTQPNYRTKLEILKELNSHLHRPALLDEILSVHYVKLLRNVVWANVSADSGYSMISSTNNSSVKLQLHLVSLEILEKLIIFDRDKFIGLDVIRTGDLSRLFDLVDGKNKHVYCCLDELGSEWSKEHTAIAYNEFLGSTFGVLKKRLSNKTTYYGDLNEVVLTTEDGSTLVSELLATKGVLTPLHFRSYDPATARSTEITDYCRVSHVISPGYVWVQWREDWAKLDQIQHELSHMKLRPLSRTYSNECVIVKPSNSAMVYRARIMDGYSALGPDPALVLAIDFGWTCTVPKCDMYEEEKVLGLDFEYNIACLCRLTDVIPSENHQKKLLPACLRLLYHITTYPNWAKAAFSDRSNATILLTVLCNSHDLETLRTILFILSNAAADTSLGRLLLDPLTAQVGKFMKCPDLMRPVMLFYRTLVTKCPDIARKLAMGRGMVLIMDIYSKHRTDDAITEHFVAISKEIFSGVALTVPEAISQPESNPESMADVTSAPRVTRPVHDRSAIPTLDHKFSQMDNMRDHGIQSGEEVAFVQHYDSAHYRDEIRREIASLLNHRGGVVYVGVVPDSEHHEKSHRGEIRGLRLNKAIRDAFRLKIDDALTDNEIFRRTLDEPSKIPDSLVDIEFKNINNTFNSDLRGDDLMIATIRLKSLGKSGGLVKFFEADAEPEYRWRIYGRNGTGRVEMSANAIREKIAQQVS